MDTGQKRLIICTARPATLREFIEFWEPRYFDDQEKLYTANINGPHTTDTLTELFKWKDRRFGRGRLYANGEDSFRLQIEKAERLMQKKPEAQDFLHEFSEFPNRGAIYRIFWLHCWYPRRFPIYDQHVHRAMVFIQSGQVDELQNYNDQQRIEQYLRYVPLFEPFRAVSEELYNPESDGVPGRKADRALVKFGLTLQSRMFRELI
jgi:hypothetical protein